MCTQAERGSSFSTRTRYYRSHRRLLQRDRATSRPGSSYEFQVYLGNMPAHHGQLRESKQLLPQAAQMVTHSVPEEPGCGHVPLLPNSEHKSRCSGLLEVQLDGCFIAKVVRI